MTTHDTSAPTWPGGGTLRLANVDADRVTLEWPEAKDNVGVAVSDIPRRKQIKEVPKSIQTYRDTGLKLGQTYRYAVCAQDSVGIQSSELPAAATTHDTSAPSWPSGYLHVEELGLRSVKLSWGGALDNVGISQYQISMNDHTIGTTPRLRLPRLRRRAPPWNQIWLYRSSYRCSGKLQFDWSIYKSGEHSFSARFGCQAPYGLCRFYLQHWHALVGRGCRGAVVHRILQFQ